MPRLFWISFLLLFLEILCIRWLGSELPIVRNHPNLVLMLIFIGAAAGLSGRGASIPDKLAAVAGLVVWAFCALATSLRLDHLSLRVNSLSALPNTALSIAALTVLTASLVISFMRLGWHLGRHFQSDRPLRSYSVNLLGSIAGVIGFAVISALNLGPAWWLAVACVILVALSKRVSFAPAALALVLATFFLTQAAHWSPYNKVTVQPIPYQKEGMPKRQYHAIYTNNIYMEDALEILPQAEAEKFCQYDDSMSRYVCFLHKWLDIPFAFAPRSDNVLILASGSGNDTAFALSRHTGKIDAVEIDPVIAEFGRTLHPNHPYTNARAALYVEDARNFLRYTQKRYDIVYFAYLDAGVRRGALSFMREDTFAYTAESFKSALDRITPGGIVAVSFAAGPDFLPTSRLYWTITEANGGKQPLALATTQSVFFIFGPGLKEPYRIPDIKGLRQWKPEERLRPATDDWPFLYVNFRSWEFAVYVATMALTVLVPAVLLTFASKQTHNVTTLWWAMLFLGQGFMLIETKAISQLSLVFGATWVVNVVVTLTVLVLAWAANLLIHRRPTNINALFGLLFVALALDFFWRLPQSDSSNPLQLGAIYSLITCLPVFFSGMIFSSLFKRSDQPAAMLSANLLGIALGGLCENFSMLTGIKGLTLLAAVIYAAAYYFSTKASTKVSTPESESRSPQ